MSDRPILLLHGWTMRGAVFDDMVRALGPRAQAPDMPGHGAADGVEAGLDACVEQVAATIAASGRDDTLLVGWSMGAAVAWLYLSQHSTNRVGGLVTLDMSPRPANGPDWALGLSGQTAVRRARATDEIHNDWPCAAEKIATTMFADRDGAPGFSRSDALAQILSNDPATMARYWDELLQLDLRSAMPSMTLPWLVGHGTRSKVYPAATAQWLADTAPNARALGFDGAGHSPHLEAPGACLAALRQFESRL